MEDNPNESSLSTQEYKENIFDPDKLRKMRKSLRMTQSELASMLDIHRTYLVLIENRKKIPSPRLQRYMEEFMYKAEQESHSHKPFVFEPSPPNARLLTP